MNRLISMLFKNLNTLAHYTHKNHSRPQNIWKNFCKSLRMFLSWQVRIKTWGYQSHFPSQSKPSKLIQ
ncbi:hypothetical protein E2C01_004487 [Portunus trituberculatus]|uniref:Uncharacterized protein n=1 Tax=Portunus trituberculatus TaxID=210409 RepID=A0A5B7CQ46_PORTR|nr:hypothetical protein [Portunus trituberculatus]